jgi:hypothetical protein
MDRRDAIASGDELTGPDLAVARFIEEIIALYREFPDWAVWLPTQGVWTAVRPASTRPPAPELPMIWTRANSVSQLADHMRETDQQFGEF